MSTIIIHKRPPEVSVKCCMCRRTMTIKRENGEHPPYYCYKCWDKFGD